MSVYSWRRLGALYLPLMLSGLLMTLEAPLITAGIARQMRPELFLAAFGVAFAIALIYEAPVIMVLEASIALGGGRDAYLVLRRAYLVLGLALTALGVLLFYTPLYTLFTGRLMGIPPEIATAARPALMILTFWPLPVGWRRLHQGILIRADRTHIISAATGVRLAVLALILFGGAFRHVPGAVLGAGAMVAAVAVEAALVTPPALRTLPDGGRAPASCRALWAYYWPLAMTTLLQQANRPLITAGIAAASHASLSLAAWPVLLSVVMFTFGALMALQQVAVAVSDEPDARRRTARFVLLVGGALTALLVVVTHSALLDALLLRVFGVSTAIADTVTPAARLLAVTPVVFAVQAFLRGTLIRDGQTWRVQQAMVVNLVTVAVVVGLGAAASEVPGIMVGAGAMLAGGVTETAALWRAQSHRPVAVAASAVESQ